MTGCGGRCLLVLALTLTACPAADDAPASESDGSTTGTPDGSTGSPPPLTTAATTTGDPATSTSDLTATVGTETGETTQSGCGLDPGFTGAKTGAITAMDLERRFTIVVPDDYDADHLYPLVFMLHGRGSNGEQLRQYAGVEEAAAGQAIFVYPDGLPVESMGNATGWELGGNDRDVALVDALIAEFTANLCIDEERIFASGHSFGGFFSNALGCARGDVFRAIAPVSGGGPSQSCTGQVAAWITHGDGDETVTPFFGEMTRDFWRNANGCDPKATEPVDPAPCEASLGCDEGYPVHWCFHMESAPGIGAHLWPSFAGEAIWAFFSSF